MVGITPSAFSFYANPSLQAGSRVGLLPQQALTTFPGVLPLPVNRQTIPPSPPPVSGMQLMAGLFAVGLMAAFGKAKGLGATTTGTATTGFAKPPAPVANTVTLPTGAQRLTAGQIGTLATDTTLQNVLTGLNNEASPMGKALMQNALAKGTKIMSQAEALASDQVPANAKSAFTDPDSDILALHIDSDPPIIIIGDKLSEGKTPAAAALEIKKALMEEMFHDVDNAAVIERTVQTKAAALQSLGVNVANLNNAPDNGFVEEGFTTKLLNILADGGTPTQAQFLAEANKYAGPYLNNTNPDGTPKTDDDDLSDASIDMNITMLVAMGVNPAQLVNLRPAVEQFRANRRRRRG